ncbi:MAG TPA: hypothetical protein VGP72_04850 [Planctomycetota bacterium]|jgi:hypothetical protein
MKTFELTADFPTPIVADFETFLAGVEQPTAYLTKAKLTLDRATLHALDGQMRTFRTNTHPRTDQECYPLLDLFQRICMATRMHMPQPGRGELRMVPTELVAGFRGLSTCEKYMALLEALWVDVDWSDLGSRSSMFGDEAKAYVPHVFCKLPIGQAIALSSQKYEGLSMSSFEHQVPQMLSFYGLLACKQDDKATQAWAAFRKGAVRYTSVKVTEFGHEVFRILKEQQAAAGIPNPLLELFGDAESPEPDEAERPESPADAEPFFAAFQPLFADGLLKQGFPFMERKTKGGTFVFRVSLGKETWRTIAMSGEHTLDDLHMAIQSAFKFDNDHLYGFYMDNKRYSKNCYNDSRGEEGPFADEAVIGQLDVWLHQRFLYIFDFGDQWEFSVELLEIRDQRHKGAPKILVRMGKSPQQYRDAEW